MLLPTQQLVQSSWELLEILIAFYFESLSSRRKKLVIKRQKKGEIAEIIRGSTFADWRTLYCSWTQSKREYQ
jgi:hypothetical protein